MKTAILYARIDPDCLEWLKFASEMTQIPQGKIVEAALHRMRDMNTAEVAAIVADCAKQRAEQLKEKISE